MKILLLAFMLLPITNHAQDNENYQIGDLMITIPENYQETDTLGQKLIMAQIEDGFILISQTSNSDMYALNISNDDELLEFYAGFQKGVIKSSEGELISEVLVFKDGLKWREFSFRVENEEKVQVRNCLSLLLNDNTYAIQFWQPESMMDQKKEERERLFKSIKLIPNLSGKSQFSQNMEYQLPSNVVGYMIGRILGYLILFGVLILFVRWVSGKFKKNTTKA